MAFTTAPVDGAKSVKLNRPTLNANALYIQDNMRLDHFWNEDNDKDGHHDAIQMPIQGTIAAPTNPTLATGLDGVVYLKHKIAADSGSNQDVQPYFQNETTINAVADTPFVMQMLGVRAAGVVTITNPGSSGSISTAATGNPWDYAHNISNVVRDSNGDYTITFANELPTNNYLVHIDAVGPGSGNTVTGFVLGTSTLSTSKSTTFVKLRFVSVGAGASRDPLQFWFTVWGG